VRVNGYAGSLVNTARAAPSTDQTFYALSADFGTFAEAWDMSLYALTQDYVGYTDRQAIGTEIRYFRPGLTFVGLADYDIHFGDLNDVLLLATAALPSRWTMSVNLDHRKSPGLSLRNALIGQQVQTFDELFSLYSSAQVEQFAQEITSDPVAGAKKGIGAKCAAIADWEALGYTGSEPAAGDLVKRLARG
jgi:hypothetical protein